MSKLKMKEVLTKVKNKLSCVFLPKTTYVYQDPRNLGYRKVKLSRKEAKEIVARKVSIFDNYVLFYKEDGAFLHRYYNWIVSVLNIALIPVYIVIDGVASTGNIYRDIVKQMFQNKYGSFRKDYIAPRSSSWNTIEKIVKEKGK